MKAGYNQTETAKFISVHKSTISRELCRNHGLRGYRPKQAHHLAIRRQQSKVSPRLPTLVRDASDRRKSYAVKC